VVVVASLVHAGRHIWWLFFLMLMVMAIGGGDTVPVVLAVDGPRHPGKPCCYAEKLLLYY